MSNPEIPAGTWDIDPAHTTVGFTVRHMMVSKVRGRFGSVSGVVTTTPELSGSHVEASVDMTSVDTGDANRDQHLRTSDFFDIEQFPSMDFTSSALKVLSGSGSDYELTGDLTIRGVTKPVTLNLDFGGVGQDPWGGTRIGLEAKGTINRKDFGLEYNSALEAGGVLIGDKVSIELDVEAVLQAPADVAAATPT